MSSEAEVLGERIAEMAAHLDAATHRLLTALRDYDRSGNWYQQGFPDCARWLSWRVGWSGGTARDHLRVARCLGDLPLIDDALRTGEVSYSKVRAMVRVATSANEAMLLEDARHATGSQLELICRKYATVVRAARDADPDDDLRRRAVTRRDLEDGMVQIAATLHPEEAAVVWAALDRLARERCQGAPIAQDSTAPAEPTGLPRGTFSRPDALVAMAEGVVRGDAPRRSAVELVVTLAEDVLHRPAPQPAVSAETADAPIAVFADGTCVSAEAARRLACDCGVVHVTEDPHGNTLSIGRKTRSIPGAIKRALLKRDACCRFPGCTNRLYVEGHHIKHWADGGETALDNLVGVCGFHHRFVHEYGYGVELDAAQQPRFFDRRGCEVRDVPDRATPDGLGWQGILEANAVLSIDASTNECLWDGDRPHYGDIIDALVRIDDL